MPPQLAGKHKISSFSDPNLSDGVIILNLIDKLKPGCVNQDLVKKATVEEVSAVVNCSDWVLRAVDRQYLTSPLDQYQPSRR